MDHLHKAYLVLAIGGFVVGVVAGYVAGEWNYRRIKRARLNRSSTR